MAAIFASSSRQKTQLQGSSRDLVTPKYQPQQRLLIAASLHVEISGPLKSFGMNWLKINKIVI